MANAAIVGLCVGASLAMGFLLVVLLARYFVRPFRDDVLSALCGAAPARRHARPERVQTVLLFVAAVFLVSRLFAYTVGLVSAWSAGQSEAYLRTPLTLWMRWDANHYAGLAENWYVNEGDARLHLVFFPLFPLIMRGLYLFVHMDASWAGALISNVCLLVSGWALFRVVEMEQGGEGARRAVRYLMFAPLSFFFSIPYSESLFLMLTLLSVLFARRRRFGWAVLCGALAANARVLGLLSAAPIYYEYLMVVKEKKGGWRMALKYALATLPVALGFAAYLWLNWQVSGDPFRFLTYQKEHWSQRMGSLCNTLSYTLTYALEYENAALRWGTWIPQALYILVTIGLMLALYRKVSPGDGAYALLYLYLAVSPTWLLSGPRYLTGMYALYPMLALITKPPRREWAVLGLSLAGSCYMIYMYLVPSGVL